MLFPAYPLLSSAIQPIILFSLSLASGFSRAAEVHLGRSQQSVIINNHTNRTHPPIVLFALKVNNISSSSSSSSSSSQMQSFKRIHLEQQQEAILAANGGLDWPAGGECDSEMAPPPLNSLSWLVYSVLMPVVCLLGSIGALICVFIFTRRQMRSSLSIYLAALSSFDFVLLFCAAIIYPSMNLCLQEGNRGPICHFFWRSSLATYPLSLMAQTASVWTVVAITVDRYLAVRYPLHMRAWCTPYRARTVVMFITVVAVLFKMPSFFEVSLNGCGHLVKTALRDDHLYIVIYYTYGYLLLMLAAPFLFIIVLNAKILSIIRLANLQRREMNVVRRSSRVTRCSRGSSGCAQSAVGGGGRHGSSASWINHLQQHALQQKNGTSPLVNGTGATTAGNGIIGHQSVATANGGMTTNNNWTVAQGQAQCANASLLPAISLAQQQELVTVNSIDNRCTKMAVVTIAAFVAFNWLAGMNHVIEAFNLLQDHGQNIRIPIGNFLVCLNSATNIFIYSIFGRRFRKMFVRQFCPCRGKYIELNRSTCLMNKTELV